MRRTLYFEFKTPKQFDKFKECLKEGFDRENYFFQHSCDYIVVDEVVTVLNNYIIVVEVLPIVVANDYLNLRIRMNRVAHEIVNNGSY